MLQHQVKSVKIKIATFCHYSSLTDLLLNELEFYEKILDIIQYQFSLKNVQTHATEIGVNDLKR